MKTKRMVILFSSIAIAMTGYGIALPLFPFLIEKYGGGGLQIGLLVASYGVMQLLFAPVWGSLSDKYGRKPMLLIGMSGLGAAMIFFGLSTQLWMLYAAQLLSGALSSGVFPVAMAYTSDITEGDERGGAMGKIGAAAGLGIILGPAIGGLLGAESLYIPFFAAAGFAFITCLIIWFGLPESLPENKRSAEKESVKLLKPSGLWQALLTPMAFGLIIAFAVNFGKSNFSSVYGLYALERFGYGPREVGIILMVMSFIYLLAQGFIVGPLTKKFGEEKVIKTALIGNAAGFIFIMAAETFVVIILSVSFFILLNALLKPSALAFVSRRSVYSQGRTMGITESFMSLGRILGPLWAGSLFDFNYYYPFISGAVIFLIMFGVSFILTREKREVSAPYEKT
ncbi:MFS transporter [Salipaludibacillus sp. CUR1]|uniref:MFS transporter n=1 Tax=Salipaludibacillus sp. CUR1 TaxID=2820003 RepID=UPI001E4FD565|nr:MFS transporter [Salipaludibacillus sp. CUR1]MCE7792327.1 MFS transporter [Salipaludibacillus sp. CUR1]